MDTEWLKKGAHGNMGMVVYQGGKVSQVSKLGKRVSSIKQSILLEPSKHLERNIILIDKLATHWYI